MIRRTKPRTALARLPTMALLAADLSRGGEALSEDEPAKDLDFSNRRFGVLLTFLAVVCYSPDAVWLRLIRAHGLADELLIVTLKLAGKCVLVLCFLVLRDGLDGFNKALEGLREAPVECTMITLCLAGQQALYPCANLMTSAATVTFLINPMVWTCLFDVLVFGDRLPSKTWLAVVIIFGGLVAVVFLPAKFSSSEEIVASAPSAQPDTVMGDALALLASVIVAVQLVFCRFALVRSDAVKATVLWSVSAGCALGAVVVALIHTSVSMPETVVNNNNSSAMAVDLPIVVPLMLLSSAGSAAAELFLISAALYARSSDIAMALGTEFLATMLWPWLMLNDPPVLLSLPGGVLISLTVLVHELSGELCPARQEDEEEEEEEEAGDDKVILMPNSSLGNRKTDGSDDEDGADEGDAFLRNAARHDHFIASDSDSDEQEKDDDDNVDDEAEASRGGEEDDYHTFPGSG